MKQDKQPLANMNTSKGKMRSTQERQAMTEEITYDRSTDRQQTIPSNKDILQHILKLSRVIREQQLAVFVPFPFYALQLFILL